MSASPHPDGTVRDYPAGRSFRFGGYADVQIRRSVGQTGALAAYREVVEVRLDGMDKAV